MGVTIVLLGNTPLKRAIRWPRNAKIVAPMKKVLLLAEAHRVTNVTIPPRRSRVQQCARPATQDRIWIPLEASKCVKIVEQERLARMVHLLAPIVERGNTRIILSKQPVALPVVREHTETKTSKYLTVRVKVVQPEDIRREKV